MNHYRIRISRFDFFSSIMGIAICTHISKLYIIDVNYVIYNIYISTTISIRHRSFPWKEKELDTGKRRTPTLSHDKSGRSIPKKKSRGPPTRLVRFFFPSSTAARDDFNRKITTRSRDDCSRLRRCEWIFSISAAFSWLRASTELERDGKR